MLNQIKNNDFDNNNIYKNNINIYNDIKGYIVNPRDTVCKLIYASPTHLSSDR